MHSASSTINNNCNGAIAIMQLRWPSIVALFVFALPASAELGGDPLSLPADAAARNIVRQMQRAENYNVQQTQLPTGTLVREYIAATGKVFAVAWEGPVLPDLQQILGAYFPQYIEAARTGQAGRGALSIERPELVVLSGGHMRAFFGKAYVPQLLPVGVSVGDIQ
jgi:hypothetical protein